MPQQTPAAYSAELRTLRKQLGLSQAALAAQLGVRTDSYSRYETGLRHVPEPIIRLARFLVRQAQNRSQAQTPG